MDANILGIVASALELSRPLASLFVVASSTSRAIGTVHHNLVDSSGGILVFETVAVQLPTTHRTSEVTRVSPRGLPSFDAGLAKQGATTTGLVNRFGQ